MADCMSEWPRPFFRKLDRKMTDAFAAIWEIHVEKKIPLRTAAFVKALQ